MVEMLGFKLSYEVKVMFDDVDVFLLLLVIGVDGDMEGILVVLMEVMVVGILVVFILYSGILELVEVDKFGWLVFENDVCVLV